MIIRYVAQAMDDGFEFELVGMQSLDDAVSWLKEYRSETGPYIVMERRYEMVSERATTVNNGE